MIKKLMFTCCLLTLLISCSGNSNDEVVDSVEKEVVKDSIHRITKNRIIDFDIEDILADGKLTVLAENNTSSFFIYRGRSMGYEYEVLSQFAKYLGVQLEVIMIKDANKVIERLNSGEAEMIASFYTITEEREKIIDFTDPVVYTRQVLVQRKPEGYQKMSKYVIDSLLVRDSMSMVGKNVHIFESSSFNATAIGLQKTIGDRMTIEYDTGYMNIETLIQKVSDGEIDYTISDELVAKINKKFYPNIDVEFAVSNETPIGFGVRKNSTGLRDAFNEWMKEVTNTNRFEYLKTKYFKISKYVNQREGEYSNLGGGKISKYDAIIKREAAKGVLDWRLIASLMYQESKFNINVKSWAGAFGLMQFMPATGAVYGVYPGSSATVQISGGVRKLNRNYISWLKEVPDSLEALKFTLASYNAGKGHVDDARRLAFEHGLSDVYWENNVEYYMLLLMKRHYSRDDIVKYGYVRGTEPVKYVRKIMARYEAYKIAFPEE